MRKFIAIAVVATALYTMPAVAKDGNNGGGNGGCGNGQQTNGCGDTGGDGGNVVGGGAGGAGGMGVGIAGAASNASAAVHSANANLNQTDIDNRNTISTLVGNTSSNRIGNVTASTDNANNSAVTVEGDEAQRRNPVSTAYAAPLVAAEDTCMGSSTAGAQGIGFGVSIGTTWTDRNCVRLKNSRELTALGHKDAAVQLLCTDKEVKAAMAAVGTPCR